MKVARIEFDIEGSRRTIIYSDEGEYSINDEQTPVLLIEVHDPDDAEELVAAIEKVGRATPKKKVSRPAPSAASAPPAGDGSGVRPGEEIANRTPSSGKRVAGEEGSASVEGAATPRSTAADAILREGPAHAPEQDREAGVEERLAGSGSGNGGPPTVPAAAKQELLDLGCIAPECAMAAVVAEFDDLCDLHKNVGASIHAEWLAAAKKRGAKLTLAKDGARKARGIIDFVESKR